MKQNKSALLFLLLTLGWGTLLSACGPNPSAGSASSNMHTPTVLSTSTGTSPTQTADCPAAGRARPAHLPPDQTPAQPAVFYTTAALDAKGVLLPLDLKRYDLATGKTTSIFSFPPNAYGSPQPALSPDKHWLLFTSPIGNRTGIFRLLLMRTNGTQLQTLACLSVPYWSTLSWSPDEHQVAFAGSPTYHGEQQTTYALNLLTGQEKQYLANTTYAPYAWLDNQRLYVRQDTDEAHALFLLNTSLGSNQKPGNLVPIASETSFCRGFALSADRQNLYNTTCSATICGQGGRDFHGPASVDQRPAPGGSSQSLFRSSDLGIVNIQAIDTKRVLMYLLDTHPGFPQNGLWEMNTQTRSLEHLVKTSGSSCNSEMFSQDTVPQFASNSQSYALRVASWRTGSPSLKETLQVGSLFGGTPTTIATRDVQACTCGVALVGMV